MVAQLLYVRVQTQPDDLRLAGVESGRRSTELRWLSSVTGLSAEYPRRRVDSWRIAGCHQRKGVTVPHPGPADLQHLPCRLRNSEVPELTLDGRCNQLGRLVTVSLRNGTSGCGCSGRIGIN